MAGFSFEDKIFCSFELTEQQQAAINKLKTSPSSVRFEKLVSHDLYSIRVTRRERLLFTAVKYDGNTYLCVLDVLENHDYETNQYYKSAALLKKRQEILLKALSVALLTKKPTAPGFDAPYTQVTCFNKNVISLNKHQEEILEELTSAPDKQPLLIAGISGTGKTALAKLIAEHWCLSGENEENYLYITSSEFLVQNMRDMLPPDSNIQISTYLNLALANNQGEQSRAISFAETLARIKDQQALTRTIYKVKNEVAPPCLQAPADIIYSEFRILSGYSKEDYLNLAEEQSHFSPAEREWLWSWYEKYSAYCKENHLIDEAFIPLPIAKQYAGILIDETQILSRFQLSSLVRFANLDKPMEKTKVIFCYGSHQDIFDTKPLYPFLTQKIPDLKQHHLIKSYRCPKKIMEIAHNTLKIQNYLAGGISYKGELLSSPLDDNANLADGEVNWLTLKELRPDLCAALSSDSDCAIFSFEESKQEARELFKTGSHYTPQQILGSEFAVVVVYGALSGKIASEIHKALPDARAYEELKINTNRPKYGKSDNRHSTYLC
jgi:hypothetical protein